MRPVRVLLADDHALLRAGIRALLEKMPGIEVIAEAANGRHALALMESQRPDVVLMDLAMPGLNGIEGTAQAARKWPNTPILILSMYADEEHVLQALRVGAAGYLVKDAVPAELELAVRAVTRGEMYLSSAVARYALRARAPAEATSPLERLTPRLREILQLIAEGHTTKEIARILETSPKTVENHRARLMQRLGVNDVASLVRYALQYHLVEAHP
jgi:DNA-binding NarL/FixJ family response regulator